MPLAQASLPNRVGFTWELHVTNRKHFVPPHHANVAERVIDEANRIVAHRRVDVLLPQSPVLVEVLIRVDDAHGTASRLWSL